MNTKKRNFPQVYYPIWSWLLCSPVEYEKKKKKNGAVAERDYYNEARAKF